MWEGGNFRLLFLSYKDPVTVVFNQNCTGRQRLTTKAQGMPKSERESGKRGSGRENERQPPLKEEREASPPLLNESSSPQNVEHLTSRAADGERMQYLQLLFQNSPAGPIRPSVLRSTALLLQANESHQAAMNRRKDTGHRSQISIQAVAGSSQHRKHSPSFHSQSHVESEIQRSSSLFINGQCRWPGCDKVFEGYTYFLRHLNQEHSTDEKTIAQWRVQQDLVRHMENQLIQEKQKLHAMQLHLHLFEYIATRTGSDTGWWRRLALNMPLLGEPDGRTERTSEALVRQEPWHMPPPHLLPDFVNSVEYYKYANLRPPYTYAFLIRWSILEAPDKQRTLNEIYNWFTRMFFYFRHNSPTWKNAVRHNLSLHKCFVRVDGRSGAVWTVDEEEFQKRKGQKIHRDYTFKWLTPVSHCPSHEASDVSITASNSQ
ncbi:forkhead box protein P3 isoform X2 [Puntigrus tetrazona]|uniref:forkhead box protein P3 isoform X2 n=1 Tax=Puntigrus tetrazona TaxID=1606681 RepID=UPI001C895DBD|nr:forkhead box protein P3 isoform X2 [Puntigrus tetrazona]